MGQDLESGEGGRAEYGVLTRIIIDVWRAIWRLVGRAGVESILHKYYFDMIPSMGLYIEYSILFTWLSTWLAIMPRYLTNYSHLIVLNKSKKRCVPCNLGKS